MPQGINTSAKAGRRLDEGVFSVVAYAVSHTLQSVRQLSCMQCISAVQPILPDIRKK